MKNKIVSDDTVLLVSSFCMRFFFVYAYFGALGEHAMWVLLPAASARVQHAAAAHAPLHERLKFSLMAALRTNSSKLLANVIFNEKIKFYFKI